MSIETNTSVWIAIEKALNARLDSLRKQNDANHTETETAMIRGRIAEVKNLLRLPEMADPVTEVGPDE